MSTASRRDLVLGRAFTLCGPVALVAVWITIAVSWYYNSAWFSFYNGALSDFGGNSARYPFIYNYGLMITALFLFLFSLSLIYRSRNKLETVASAFSVIASVFLAQIGIFHGGTYPHDYVSLYYFVQQDASLILWGVALFLREAKPVGAFVLIIGIVFLAVGGGVPLPGSAILETYGILTFGAWAFLMNSFRLTREPRTQVQKS